jgi:ATP phosphoribosyltransferase regulatory subunit
MMRKMGRRDGAIGFAVYLDSFASYAASETEFDADVLLLKNGADATAVLIAVEQLSAQGERVIVTEALPDGIRARKTMIMKEGEAVQYGND